MTNHVREEVSVRELFDYLEEHDLPYEVLENYDGYVLAQNIGEIYPYNPDAVTKYLGEFNGEEITCFITVGGDNGMVWSIYGTIDDSTSVNDCIPSYDLGDKAVRVR